MSLTYRSTIGRRLTVSEGDQNIYQLATLYSMNSAGQQGAIGDGTSDDTTAIAAAITEAIDTAASNGKDTATVFLPPGTFKITGTGLSITPSSGIGFVHFIGAGRNRTRLAWYGTASNAVVTLSEMRGVRFSDMEIFNTDSVATSIGVKITGSGGDGSGTGSCILEELLIDGFQYGIEVGDGSSNAASEITYREVTVRNCTTAGIRLRDGNSVNHWFYGCSGTGNARVLSIESSAGGTIHWFGGSFGTSTVADMCFLASLPATIINTRSENSARMMFIGSETAAAGSNGSDNTLTLIGCKHANTTAADNRAICIYGGVKLTMIGCVVDDGHVHIQTSDGSSATRDAYRFEQCTFASTSDYLFMENDDNIAAVHEIWVEGCNTSPIAQMANEHFIWRDNASRYSFFKWHNDLTFALCADATNTKFGIFGATPVARQASGADLTNSVTSGGTDDTIANYTDLTTYATDAAAIRNNIYQLARKLKQVNDALRDFGYLS